MRVLLHVQHAHDEGVRERGLLLGHQVLGPVELGVSAGELVHPPRGERQRGGRQAAVEVLLAHATQDGERVLGLAWGWLAAELAVREQVAWLGLHRVGVDPDEARCPEDALALHSRWVERLDVWAPGVARAGFGAEALPVAPIRA